MRSASVTLPPHRREGGLFSHVYPEKRIPAEHPLREICTVVWEVLKALSPSLGVGTETLPQIVLLSNYVPTLVNLPKPAAFL